MRTRFGSCVFDSGTREVLRRGKPLAISPKAFRLLEVLLERRPDAVEKEALQDLVWPGVFVSEGNLSRLMNELRNAIGDDADEPHFFRTVHGYGYAFCGEIKTEGAPKPRRSASGVHCRLVMGDRQFLLSEGENLIGRDPALAVWIDKSSVSRRHARVLVTAGAATLEDLGSRNGTYVGGKRVESPMKLSSGDSIKVGVTTMIFRSSRGLGTTESEISSHASEPGRGSS